jgi:hypothetical protein
MPPQGLPDGTMRSRQELDAAANAFCAAHVVRGRLVPPACGVSAGQHATGAADGGASAGSGSGSGGSSDDLVRITQHASSGLLGAAASSSLGHSSSSSTSATTSSSAAPGRGAASAALEAAGTWLRQVWALVRRERAGMLRNPTDVAGRALVFCWLGLLVGVVFYNLGYEVTAFRTRAQLLLVQLLVPLLLPFCYMSWYIADKRVRRRRAACCILQLARTAAGRRFWWCTLASICWVRAPRPLQQPMSESRTCLPAPWLR